MNGNGAIALIEPPGLDMERLIEMIREPVCRYLVRKVHRDDVDDLFQDVCLKVIASIHTLKNPNKLMSWVYAVTGSKVMDHYRAVGRRLDGEIEDWDVVVDPGTARLSPEERLCVSQIRKHINQLSGDVRDVAALHFLIGLPPREICDSLELNINTVKSHIQRTKTWILTRMAA